MTKEYEEFLAHYGIKGQKWGVRNYQDASGSLTAEGRLRYLKPKDRSTSWKKKEATKLSDEDLNSRNSRLQRESQYVQSLKSRHPVKSAIKSNLSDAANKIFVKTAVTILATMVALKYKDKLANSDFVKDRFPEFVESLKNKK